MADTRRNRFNFERHYYGRTTGNNVVGSVAKAVDAVREYEEDYDENSELLDEEYTERDFETESPLRRGPKEYITTPLTSLNKEEKPKTKYNFGFLEVLMIVILLVAIVNACYTYIQARADVIQMNKKIQAAKEELADIQNKNAALMSDLDVETDRNKIYSIAVQKLNMIYPKENDTVYYEQPYEGYVRQYYDIPAVK